MASSTTQSKIISLGNQLVALLDAEHNVDQLTRWMAHYVAEQITLAESATGEAKATAEARCYDTILKLWAHRGDLPVHSRPFERFATIFRVLERIDPESAHGFYHRFGRDEPPKRGSLEAMIQFIIDLDDAARILLELGLVAAVERATDEQTEKFLRDAVPAVRDREVDAVQKLVDLAEEPHGADAEKKLAERLRSRIDTLDRFAKMCAGVRENFATQLKGLEGEKQN